MAGDTNCRVYMLIFNALRICMNKAAPYLNRLVAGFPPRRPGFKPGSSHVGFVVEKWRWGRFSPSISVSSANLYSTNFFTITLTYHPGLVQ
jgi:hypothetical protein